MRQLKISGTELRYVWSCVLHPVLLACPFCFCITNGSAHAFFEFKLFLPAACSMQYAACSMQRPHYYRSVYMFIRFFVDVPYSFFFDSALTVMSRLLLLPRQSCHVCSFFLDSPLTVCLHMPSTLSPPYIPTFPFLPLSCRGSTIGSLLSSDVISTSNLVSLLPYFSSDVFKNRNLFCKT